MRQIIFIFTGVIFPIATIDRLGIISIIMTSASLYYLYKQVLKYRYWKGLVSSGVVVQGNLLTLSDSQARKLSENAKIMGREEKRK